METVAYTMQVPKESKEIIDAIEQIVVDAKAGKPIAEIVAGALPKLISAIDGYEKLPEELKSQGKDELAGYTVHKVLGALL